jgi:hypothetical protein
MSMKEVKKMVETWFSWAKGIAPQITYPDPKMCNNLKLIL